MSERRVIKLEQQKTLITATGKCCLWFAWADSGLNGPEGEISIDLYRPIEIDITNQLQVTVSAEPADQWSHHPGVLSNAAGIDDERDLENPNYRSATYNSSKIVPLKARLNLLVGMIGKETAPTHADPDVDQIKIGLHKVIPINDNTATRLFLGFHDGREWTNNDGPPIRITVTIP